MPDEFEEEPLLQDSIRNAQISKRRPEVAHAIERAVELERSRKIEDSAADGVFEGAPRAFRDPRKKANREDALPLSPARAAKQGLTSILPPIKVKGDAKFQRFLMEVTDPDLRATYPTWVALSRHFEVSVQTLKTWMLSEEVSKSLEIAVSHEARMQMPSVMRAVRLRAQVTGDPHAAEWMRKVAKMGTAETDASKSFERTLRQIAADRRREERALPTAVPSHRIIEEAQEVPVDAS